MQATMNHSRRQLPPVATHKRKERDETSTFLKQSTTIKPPQPKLAKPMPKTIPPRAMAPIKPSKVAVPSPPHHNMLLAGYLAHEFLTKGTLLGQLYDPARAMGPPAYSAARSADSRTMKEPSHGSVNKEKGKTVEPKPNQKPSENKSWLELHLANNQRYAEVSELLKNGAHIPGIVNPLQLARFLHLQENK